MRLPPTRLSPLTQPRLLTARAALLGLGGGSLICAFASYNDQAMQNTPLIGNNMPLGAMMLLFGFVLLVNGPLSRWRPDRAFSGFETAVAFTIMLVMCAVPSSGLMRYLLPNLAVPFHYGVESASYRAVLQQLHLAPWLFPSFEGKTAADWIGDPLATNFYDHWVQADRSPFGRWVTPFIAWGIFTGALFWSLLCMATIVMRQWRDNEHLAFPLATIQLSLIEAPQRGQWLNRVLRARSFWIAFFAVLFLHVNNGLAIYFPKNVVPISRGFDLVPILNDKPWSFTDPTLRQATIYFSMIGVAFFLSGPVAFSLWFFVILVQIYKIILGTQTGDSNVQGINEQRHGAAIALFLSILWLGRKHWATVIRQALRGVRPGESEGRYLSYRTAAWGIAGGCIVMFAWLVAAGATVLGAINIVAVLMIAFVLITRVIAETGLIHGAMPISILKPIEMLGIYTGVRTPLDTVYLSSIVQATNYDYREVVPVYATHGMRSLDETKPDGLTKAADQRVGRQIILLLGVGLVLAYAISFWSSLWTNYHYGVTLDMAEASPIDWWGVRDNPKFQVLDPSVVESANSYARDYSRAGHTTFGFAVTVVLSILRLRFAWWPLHPIGYLIYGTFPSVKLWFSIFLGWLAKLLVLRFGSATFYERCKPFFIGLILGESAAAGVWLIASLVLHACDVPYRSYLVLPQ